MSTLRFVARRDRGPGRYEAREVADASGLRRMSGERALCTQYPDRHRDKPAGQRPYVPPL